MSTSGDQSKQLSKLQRERRAAQQAVLTSEIKHLAHNTQRAYVADLSDYLSWLEDVEVAHGRSDESVKFTLLDLMEPSVVAQYLRHLRAKPSSSATLARRLSMIQKIFHANGATTDPRRDASVQDALGEPFQQDGVLPLTQKLLVDVLEAVDLNRPVDRRDTALMLIGWFGALRPGELTSLTTDSVRVQRDSIVITLNDRRSAIAAYPNSKWDPVQRLAAWQETLSLQRSNSVGDTKALWVATTKSGEISTPIRPLAARTLNDMITRRTVAAGLAGTYSITSLRAGFLAPDTSVVHTVVRHDWP